MGQDDDGGDDRVDNAEKDSGEAIGRDVKDDEKKGVVEEEEEQEEDRSLPGTPVAKDTCSDGDVYRLEKRLEGDPGGHGGAADASSDEQEEEEQSEQEEVENDTHEEQADIRNEMEKDDAESENGTDNGKKEDNVSDINLDPTPSTMPPTTTIQDGKNDEIGDEAETRPIRKIDEEDIGVAPSRTDDWLKFIIAGPVGLLLKGLEKNGATIA